MLLASGPSHAGAFTDHLPGVEGQQGLVPAAFAPDGSALAVTRWDKAGLAVLDLRDGALMEVSAERGAGFHPVWTGEGLLFKEVLSEEGSPLHRVLRWRDGERVLLDRGARLGDVSASAAGTLSWSRGRALRLGTSLVDEAAFDLPAYIDLAELDPAGARIAITDSDGRVGLMERATGGTRWLDLGPGHAHPSFSDDGAFLLVRSPGGLVTVVEVSSGEQAWQGEGRHPRWLPGSHRIVADLPVIDGFEVIESDLWLVDLDRGTAWSLGATPAHERHPLPSPDGRALVYTDTRDGSLWWAPLGDSLGEPTLLAGPDLALDALPPPPPPLLPWVDVPYLHQLWDTPNEFPGYWSCGPSSCVMVTQKYQRLPDHDITCAWPYEHVSHWGWYIPNEYTFDGYTYDTWGVTYGDTWCQGAHGFICREYGGAVGQYMIDFLTQHGLVSFWGGTAWSAMTAELDEGYPMVVLADVLDSGHLIVARGYDDDHSFVVNEPYGDANGEWGQYDGEGAVYDWQGYNNGHLEIEVTYLFGSEGPDVLPWSAELVELDAPSSMLSGQQRTATFRFLNTGESTWEPGEVFLGTADPQGRSSSFEEGWPAADRAATVASETAPGAEGSFEVTLLAPEVEQETTFEEAFQLVKEGHCWFGPECEETTLVLRVLPASANQPPEAVAEVEPTVARGDEVLLDGRGSTDADGVIASWTWSTPTGTLEGETATWTPTELGPVTITLTVVDDLGASASADLQLEVLADADAPGYRGPEQGCACGSAGRRGAGFGLIALLGLAGVLRRPRR